MIKYMSLLILSLFGIGAIISGIIVVSSQNPVHAIVNLILAFINSVGIFLLLGVDFIGILYLIVYVGAIAILFLFVVMMLNVRKMPTFSSSWIKTYPLGFLIGILYLVELYGFISTPYPITDFVRRSLFLSNGNSENFGSLASLASGRTNIEGLGEMLYKECGFEFLIVISLILLVAMIGAILLTIKDHANS